MISDENDDDGNCDLDNTLVLEIDGPSKVVLPSFPKPSVRRKLDRLSWEKVEADQVNYDDSFGFDASTSEEDMMDIDLQLPIDYFRRFFEDNLLKHIVDQSNLYSIQKNPNKPLALDQNELEQWLGLCLYFSISKISNTKLQWSKPMAQEIVTSAMTRDRFQQIKSNFHLVDNSTRDPSDKIFKVRPLIDHLRKKFKEVEMHELLCIDEQMVPFKGISSLKQYIPKKPHKWGFKFFVLADCKGFVYDFFPYVGKIDRVCNDAVPDLGPSSNSVLQLAECIPSFRNHKLYMDNWFSSIALYKHLATRGIWCTGTVQANRLRGLTFRTDKQLMLRGRGFHEEYKTVSDGITITAVKWVDTRSVCLLSSFLQAEPLGQCERYDKKIKAKIEIPQPCIVKFYNKNMGGVDLNDQLISLYRISFRVRKYYHKMLFHMIDMTVVNCWLLYRRDAGNLSNPENKQLSLLKFKLSLADSLIKGGKDCLKKGDGNRMWRLIFLKRKRLVMLHIQSH